MDIPSTGAIFTLGKSHLAENTQSYFYIKNDPVKRLISGPHQSAVICESGRLFVWGENEYGQLGIGSQMAAVNNNNNKNSIDTKKTTNPDIITKPTCVKSLKTLGLKIADIAYGSDWSIILTHSNELFFTGRNIFPTCSNVARNFVKATVADEQCEIIRKPFRLEELDDCLAKNEDAECFASVLAGNDHFVLMTTFGRLIAWGSNQNCQLGLPNALSCQKPHEIDLGAPVQQFVCGPESTLVLTTTGKLYFTGHLNEFVFSQFTELQQNLAPTEQIIFMHISRTNEIFIVTNSGSIYRSMESVRSKSLIFQRFYDYDSEENGPIWKLLKGFSFYAVLTKANKFYTTFSESGHHLKTFREISKFKNLRLLDMAVGNKHILVHGIPRSSTMLTSAGPGSEPHRFASRTFVMPSTVMNGSAKTRSRESSAASVKAKDIGIVEATDKKMTDVSSNVMANGEGLEKTKSEAEERKNSSESILNGNVSDSKPSYVDQENFYSPSEHQTKVNGQKQTEGAVQNTLESSNYAGTELSNSEPIKDAKLVTVGTAALIHNSVNSPVNSIKSIRSSKSGHSVKFSPTAVNKKTSPATDKLLRPHTPYPESNTTGSTPTTIKKTPLRNFSYEAAMDHDHIDSTSPALMDSLENISESGEVESADKTAFASTSALPIEEDEQLTVEINTTTDPLNSTIVVNEIRFINNGVDVTDNVKAASLEREDTESSLDSLDDHAHNITSKTNEALSKSNNNQLADDEEASSSREGIKTKLKEIETDVTVMSSKLKTKINEADAEVKSFVRTKASNVNEVKIDVKKELSTPAEDIIHAASEIQDEYSTQREHMNQNFTTTKTELTSKVEEANETLTDKVDNTAKKAANAATEARDSLETAAKRAAAGARDAVETVGENSKRVANDTMSAMESIGNSAKRVATGAKNAVGNAFIKMSDGTKDAVDSVAAKIVNEVQGAKENMNTMFQSKHLKPTSIEEDAVSSASEAASKGGPKTNTTTTGEDDERTTASVNSTQNSTGNPFEGSNPFETSNPFEHDEFDDVVERGKKALQEEVNKVHQQVANEAQETEKETMGKVRRFFKDMGGISCRNEKSTTVDDEPPRYTVEDQYPTPTHRSQEHNNTSKVCSIL